MDSPLPLLWRSAALGCCWLGAIQAGARAVQLIQAAGGQDVTFIAADLISVAGMAAAVEKIKTWRPALHGLVHSAMQSPFQQRRTPDGFDLAFGVQYLARYALNRALVDQLAASGDGRIVQIGAQAPKRLLPNVDDLQFERRPWRLLAALMSSQVLGYLHVQEAARRWQAQPVTVSITCVGPTWTDSSRELTLWMRLLYRLIATTPARSAANTIQLLTLADARPFNGAIFFKSRHFVATPLAYDAALAQRVWADAEALLLTRGFCF